MSKGGGIEPPSGAEHTGLQGGRRKKGKATTSRPVGKIPKRNSQQTLAQVALYHLSKVSCQENEEKYAEFAASLYP